MWSRNLLVSCNLRKHLLRSTSKIAVEVNPDVQRQLENAELKPQHHPGRCKTGNIILPPYVVKGITRAIGDYPIKTLHREAEAMNKCLSSRHRPPEEAEINQKVSAIQHEIEADNQTPDISMHDLSEKESEKLRKQQAQRIQKVLKERVVAWRPMSYGHFEALLYALGRGSMEYTILTKIFMEIIKRDPQFKPRSYFDFGSGVGTGMWAASNFWKNTIFEYFNVDSSRDMNELSDLILREGNENQQSLLKNVFYRQFLPATETKYNLIISSFSLFELPNSQARKEVILNLWRKCDGYLVIIEQGTRAGFELVSEARQYILKQKKPEVKGHVFSPCPHDLPCPRRTNKTDRTPCNFEVSYDTLPIGALVTKRNSTYSYVVLKAGERDLNDESNDWPRIVRETLVRKKHSICRLCTSEGNLQEIIFTTSKHGKFAYKCAKSSKWGDRLPIKVGEKFETNAVNDNKDKNTSQGNEDENRIQDNNQPPVN
ncbi:unnamed protein product [Hermetia illucens]|uniref:Methyltransferase-like protein 17, mitochondrial n=1 Tax=Hermetia illucens TaxID=343691 RepID=A0A7R8YVW8_HERIL|nr:methyltransferase-like protein 17, mitochondrial [Hermetia illucens]CAD7086221.1 unnamed protein product [Hermetia illucens]